MPLTCMDCDCDSGTYSFIAYISGQPDDIYRVGNAQTAHELRLAITIVVYTAGHEGPPTPVFT